jgi:uncharacterized protein
LGANSRLIFALAGGSFLVEVAVSALWLRVERGGSVLDLLSNQTNLLPSMGAGALLALFIALTSRFLFSTFTPDLVRDMFVPLFGGIGYREVLAISILPGIGEELLFRGVMQPALGLIPTSIIFGFLHSGLSRRLLPYGIWSGLVGAMLGLLYILFGNLWGPILAHTLVNAMGAMWVKRLC